MIMGVCYPLFFSRQSFKFLVLQLTFTMTSTQMSLNYDIIFYASADFPGMLKDIFIPQLFQLDCINQLFYVVEIDQMGACQLLLL